MATASQASVDYLLENQTPESIQFFIEKFGEDELNKHLPSGSYAGGVARSVGQGLTFGFADEMTAAAKAFFNKGDYKDLLDEERRALHRFREENPEAYAYEIGAGFLIPGVGLVKGLATAGKVALTTGKAAQAAKAGVATGKAVVPKKPITAARAAGLGAGMGGLYGVGAAEGDLLERGIGGAIGATAGAALAPAVGAVVKGVGSGIRKLRGGGLSAEDKLARPAAKRILSRAGRDVGADEAGTLAATGRAPTEAYRKTLEEMGPEAMLADVVGPRGSRFVAGVTHGSGEAGARADEVLLSRASAEYDRVTSEAARLLRARSDADRMADVLDRWAQRSSKPIYRAAEEGEGSVLNLNAFEHFFIDNAADLQKAYRRAQTIARREKEPIPDWKIFAAVKENGDFVSPDVGIKLMQRLKQGLDDTVESSRKNTTTPLGTGEFNSLKKLRNEFTTLIGEFNPTYAAANKIRAVGYKIKDAVDLGKSIGKMEPREVAVAFRKLKTDEERLAFRSGMLQDLKSLGKMETISLANKIKNNRPLKEKLRATFPDNESFNKFMQTLERESTFRKTLANVKSGARTQRTGTDIGEALGLSGEELTRTAGGFMLTPEFEGTRFILKMRAAISNLRNKKLAEQAADLLFTEPGEALSKLDQLQRIYTNLTKGDQKVLQYIRRKLVGASGRATGLLGQAAGL